MNTFDDEYPRRFNGIGRLYGQKAFTAYEAAHVVVVGLGGVGSWAAEALARTGIGRLTLIDMDVLVASNINRQLPALTETFGRGKAEVIAERARGINPRATITVIDDFLTADNVAEILKEKPSVVLDCTDDVKAKIAMVLHCRFNKIPLITVGAAGGKIDPLKIRVDDLAKTEQDPLLSKIRRQLRQNFKICKDPKEKFGVTCVYSLENMRQPDTACAVGGLSCEGYGSATTVTASFALVAVAEALKKISR